MDSEDYKKIAPSIPKTPGVYQYKDDKGTTLYVGKAKNLKNRIASYFGNKKHISGKTKTMLKHAHSLEFTLVETETDALLLESTLIKDLQPRYNVMLKDGKSYVYICIKKERFPRVFLTRRVIRDGSTYFGPYTSKYKVDIILDLIKQLFKLRTCSLNLSEKNINDNKFKVCLEYHIKNCDAPCVKYESEEEYNLKIKQIKNILKGHFQLVKSFLKEEMQVQAERLNFEKAQALKEKLTVFENYQSKSTVVSTNIKDLDVFSIKLEEQIAFVNYLKIIDGAIIHAQTSEMTMNLNHDKKQLLAFAIPILRKRFESMAQEIVVPFELLLPQKDIQITIPSIGDKKKLLDLSEKNLKYFIHQKQRKATEYASRQTSTERILTTLQKDLGIKDLPTHIECFDNSNIMGTNPVSSCVVFKNAKPSKKDYRHYNVKTVEGPNDFASMEEVVYRRYKRLLDEQQSLPQLILIDGGKGQLSAAVASLKKLDLYGKVTIVGIAKRLEELYFPGESIPLHISKKSESLKLIQHARNESHRFAINFHRLKRSKAMLHSELHDIPGIGQKSIEKLLAHFGSVKKIRESNLEEWEKVVGKAIAGKLNAYFSN